MLTVTDQRHQIGYASATRVKEEAKGVAEEVQGHATDATQSVKGQAKRATTNTKF